MKRTLVLLIAALLVLVVGVPLYAAGQREATAPEGQPLVWYVPGGNGYPYDEAEEQMVYDAFNAMLERDLGITVDVNVQGSFSEYNERMPLILASGEYMDVMWTANWSNDFVKNAYDGFYAGLDDLLENYGQDILADTREQLEATRINGEIRGVWSQQVAALNSIIRVRTDLAEKYGWDMDSVRHIRDIEPFLADVRDNEPELVPFAMPNWGSVTPFYKMAGVGAGPMGVRVDEYPIKVINFLETPEYREWVELVWDWQNKGFIPEDGVTYTRDQWNQIVNQGRNAFGQHNTYNPQLAERDLGGYWVKKYRIGEPMVLTHNIINTLMAVHSRSTRKEDSVRMLNWLWTNSEGYNTIVWGLEDRHFERLGPNQIRPIQDSGYWGNIPWMWGNTFIGYLLPGQREDLFEQVAIFNREAAPANILGFVADTHAVRTLMASVSAVVDQFEDPLQGGWVDPATGIAEFQTALDRAGFQDLMAAMQAQIDEWVASNE